MGEVAVVVTALKPWLVLAGLLGTLFGILWLLRPGKHDQRKGNEWKSH